VDQEGYLLFPEEWDREVALYLAEQLGLEMNDHRWFIVNFVRDSFEERQAVPEARHALKAMRQGLGEAFGTRKYLYQLFPYGYGQQACKIAGMRIPKKLLLDL
jgi:tRNA 2-thiouridine synthesizing protein E